MTEQAKRIARNGRSTLVAKLKGPERYTGRPAPAVPEAALAEAQTGPSRAQPEALRKRLALMPASDIKMEPVQWIAIGRVPRGKVTGIEGKMGTGKTTAMISLVAAVTTGGPFPGQETTPKGNAILISLEDSPSDTLVPRLRAAGADMSRVSVFTGYELGGKTEEGVFNLPKDIPLLRHAIVEHGAVIVGIDPLSAALDQSVNSYKDQDVRRVLAPLAMIAQETGAAIVFVRHLKKGAAAVEDAGGGSVGIGAACRSVLRVDRDPDDPERLLLSSVKSSVSRKPPTAAYRLEGVQVEGDPPIETSRLVWDGESSWTAEDLAARVMEAGEGSRMDEAMEWLNAALAGGERSAKELFRGADADGIPRRTLQRAADCLHVQKTRKGFGEGSWWSLPDPIRAEQPPFAPTTALA